MNSFRVAAVGDIMLGDHPVCYGHGVRSSADKIGVRGLLEDVTPTFRAHDLVVGNLECVLSEHGARNRDLASQELRGRPAFARELAEAGVTALSLANNHILQHGLGAFDETVQILRQNSLAPIGLADADRKSVPQIVRAGSGEVTLMAFSMRPEQYADRNDHYAQVPVDAMLAQIEEVARTGATLIVSLHWGNEYLSLPSPRQRSIAHRIIDSGATLVLGHHPHVLQPIEPYRHGLIAYSLGNLLFDCWIEQCQASGVLSVDIEGREVRRWEFLPLRVAEPWKVELLTGAEKAAALAKMDELSARWSQECATPTVTDQQYDRMADRAESVYQKDSYRYFARNLLRYSPWVVRDSVWRAVQRRLQG